MWRWLVEVASVSEAGVRLTEVVEYVSDGERFSLVNWLVLGLLCVTLYSCGWLIARLSTSNNLRDQTRTLQSSLINEQAEELRVL